MSSCFTSFFILQIMITKDNMGDYLYDKHREKEQEARETSKLQIIMKEPNQWISERFATGKAYIWNNTAERVEAEGEMRWWLFYVRTREQANHWLAFWKFRLQITRINTKNTEVVYE